MALLNVFPNSVLGNGLVYTFPQERIQAAVEELLDVSFSVRSVSYQRESMGCLYPPIVAKVDNSLVKTLPRQRKIVGDIVFCSVHVVSKGK
jgi:hypothetical protein